MRKFGLSSAVALALAAPAWASNPVPVPEVMPGPAGYPIPGAQPGYYPEFPSAAYGAPPDALPPSVGPGGPMGGSLAMPPAPGAVPPPAGGACDGFPLDPCYSHQCGPRGRVCHEYWVRGDWLYWSFRNAPVPPLIATGNPNLPGAGIPGSGNIVPLVGPSRDYGMFHGARLTFGQWFDPDGELGYEASGFIFGREGTADFFEGSAARPLSVPYVSSAGVRDAYDFSFPGRVTGGLGIRTASQLLGAEATLLHRWYSRNGVSVDGLFGYRYLSLNERLDLLGRATPDGAIGTFGGLVVPRGVTVFTTDSFRARSEFHGGQLGARAEARRDMFTFTAFGKYGVGASVQTLRVDGNSVATGLGVTRTLIGGVRALPSNFGRDTHTDFAMIAEGGVEVGFQITKFWSVRVGYNLLWWSDVLRPANVISPVVTRSQVPIDPTFGAVAVANAQPVTVFRSSDFLAHGLVIGTVFEW